MYSIPNENEFSHFTKTLLILKYFIKVFNPATTYFIKLINLSVEFSRESRLFHNHSLFSFWNVHRSDSLSVFERVSLLAGGDSVGLQQGDAGEIPVVLGAVSDGVSVIAGDAAQGANVFP